MYLVIAQDYFSSYRQTYNYCLHSNVLLAGVSFTVFPGLFFYLPWRSYLLAHVAGTSRHSRSGASWAELSGWIVAMGTCFWVWMGPYLVWLITAPKWMVIHIPTAGLVWLFI